MSRRMSDLCAKFVDLPMLPNFIRMKNGGLHPTIDVADISDSNLRAIGRRWTAALVDHAKQRRQKRKEVA